MTQRHYHAPFPSDTTRVRCPVCREAVYSRAGIHPQCAVRQSDPPRSKNQPVVVNVDAEHPAVVGVEAVIEPPSVAGAAS
jgi:hypothetical protein